MNIDSKDELWDVVIDDLFIEIQKQIEPQWNDEHCIKIYNQLDCVLYWELTVLR